MMMKKFSKLTSLLVLLISLVSATATAQTRFFLNPIDLEPGTTDTLKLMLDNPDKDTPFYGFSVDVTLPKGLQFVMKSDGKADVSLNPDRLGATYQLVTNIKDGKLLMGAFSSEPDVAIQGTSGAVVYIKVKVASDFKQSTLTLSNIKLIDAADRDVLMTQQTPTIGVLPTAITVAPSSVGLEIKEGNELEKDLTVTFTPSYTTNKGLTWTTSDPDVATVDANGKVTAVYKGTAIITATTVNGKTSTCYVSVGKPVTSVEMNPPSATIMDSETLTITATPMPLDADNRDFVQWYSSDETIATVDGSGKVEAIRTGEVTITAQCGSASGTSTVTVIPTSAKSVTVSPESAEVMVDKTIILTAEVLPDVTTDKTVTWSSSDPTKATVDEKGVVTALALGQTTITATCGTVSGTSTVTVIPTPAEKVTLSAESAEIKVGESVTLTASVSPDDTTDKTVTWSSSDPTIATVTDRGVVTGIGVGEVTVTATCGPASATCRVKVNPVLAESIEIEKSTEMRVGESVTLTATILPANTTDKTVTWTSSDEKIAIVDATGKVTGVSVGDVTVTATCGPANATCRVKVNPVLAESIQIEESAKIKVGESVTLTAIILPENTTDKTVSWSSSDETVATVDANGKVTGLKLGETIITATCGDATATCTVTVVPTPAESITLSQYTAELKAGETVEIIATVHPDDATDKTVTWTSSDESIATVDANGKITAVKIGEATITATCGEVSAKCEVTVVPTPVESISLSLTSASIKVGESVTLVPTILPDDATDKTVTWSTADGAIATVDANGKVTGVALGKVEITATCGEVTATCTVTVIPTPVESISLSLTSASIKVGESVTLVPTILPDDATDKTVTWSTADAAIATVDANGKVTGVALGEVEITATCGGATATCTVTVIPTPVESISLSLTSASIKVGESVTLVPTILPDDATDKTVTWSTADASIAMVDANGKVTGLALGEVVITATCGSATATCTVSVVPTPVEYISLNLTSATIKVGESITLTPTIIPANATDKTVTWTSADPAIATVDAEGKVTGLALGEVVITATCGSVTATCTVTVIPTPVTSITLDLTSATIKIGESLTLTPTILPEDATDKAVTWSSNNPAIATVDAEGKVTGVAVGEVEITATCGDVSAVCRIIVNPILAESITLNRYAVELMVGETFELLATVLPDDATDKTVIWATRGQSIATVDENGVITAVSLGEATISATCGNATAVCQVTVIPTPVKSLTLSQYTAQLKAGESVTIIPTVLPDDATDKTVTWTSSDESIATVDANGNVTAIAVGEVTITATCGDLTARCEVSVVPTPVTGITLTNYELVIKVGKIAELAALVQPIDATDKSVVWISDNELIATADADGNVRAVAPGVAIITVTSVSNPDVIAICKVTVETDIIAVTNITVEPSAIEMFVDETFTLTATVTPADATDLTVTWTSTDESVAVVSSEGVVTAISPGKAIIYASSSNGLTVDCDVTVYARVVEPASIALTNTELLMREGYTADLIAIVGPDNATDKTVVWASSDESIATVDQNGIVTAIKQGVTTITATTVNGLEAICTVTVVPVIIAVEEITLNKTYLELTQGDTFDLIATILPEDATDKTVTWKSSDKAIVTVSDDGVVTAVSIGTASVYASSSNGLTAECVVTVVPGIVEVTGVTLSNTELLMREGHTTDLIAIVRPDNATDKSVTWSSSDESIATVDQNGIVTAIKQGVATITVTTANGLTAICVVTVVPDVIPVESITLNRTELTMREGEGFTLIATVLPEDATDKTVTWKSSDKAVATVSDNGEVIAVRAGTAIIYASSSNGLTAQCLVTVIPGEIAVESITLSNYELLMREGHTSDLIAIVRPADATDQSVVWSSSDESIATVDQNGIVTAIKQGVAVITATTVNGLSAQCVVTVVPDFTAVESITLNRYELTIKESETFNLIATITPDNATDKTVTWKSSDTSVATVSEDGVVTGVRAGTATIYASSSNGLTAECAVTVIPGEVPVLSISLSNTELLMRKGYSTDLIAIVRPDDAFDKSVVWTSSDESIVTVDQNGIVTAHNVGVAIVRAASGYDPSVYAECRVTVVDETVIVAVADIKLNRYELNLKESETFNLIATITPDNATDKTVTWKSSDRSVATVDENGLVTGVRTGTAIIYASASNGLTAECHVTVTPEEVAVASITLSNYELLMREGHTADLIAIVLPADVTDQSVVWTSSDESIATVDQNGVVTAIKQGVTTITATASNGLSAHCVVTVIPDIVAVSSITLNRYELTLEESETFGLIATILPEDATDKTVTWKSSDRSVATVDENGVVTGVRVGTAIIYASSSNGLTAECHITVTPGEVAVESITLSNYELLMFEGDLAELIAIVRPADATDQTVVWTSDDESVATVNEYGIVSAIKQGLTTVTATSSNGLQAHCAVTVIPRVKAVEGITLNRTSLELVTGDKFNLIATITPEDATDKTVTWKSSDRTIATVSDNGEVTAVSVGVATIYASSSNGLTAECVVTVIPGEIAVESITLSNYELLMREGHSTELFAIIRPSDATDQSVIWTSNDESIVTVDQNGVVTAIKQGCADVTATSSNGLTAVCAITVVPDIVAVTGITLNRSELTITEGDIYTLIATVIPEDASDKTVTWLSSNEAIATVSAEGDVTGVLAGTAVIYASTSNGITAICDVTVEPRYIDVISITLDATDLELWEGESATLTAYILPEDATDKTVSWTSNNPTIAQVEDGVVTGVTPGEATIMAKTANGRYAYCAVTVKKRPFTPRQLLRKGDGTTNTFVIMMDLSDAELTELGYQFVVGYTDANGQSSIIAETPLRYCHTTSEIYNNKSYDFWTFAFIENEDGEIVTSNLRHLDGSEEVCFDPSKYGFDIAGRGGDANNGDDWISITPTAISISIDSTADTSVSIYTMSGIMVYSKSYAGSAHLTDVIALNQFAAGNYVVTLNCAGEVKAKKILIR